MQAQDIHTFLRSRRSVRDFADRPVPLELIERVLETATHAPNAHNRQPWRFVVLTTLDDRLKLADAMSVQFRVAMKADGKTETEIEERLANTRRRLGAAPVVVLLCSDPAVMNSYADPARQAGEAHLAAQSVALAGGQALLAAHAEGLGGVWVCWPYFSQAAVLAAFDLPEDWQPQGMLFLGYPVEEPAKRERLPLNDVVVFRE